jgi:hypothetical protein
MFSYGCRCFYWLRTHLNARSSNSSSTKDYCHAQLIISPCQLYCTFNASIINNRWTNTYTVTGTFSFSGFCNTNNELLTIWLWLYRYRYRCGRLFLSSVNFTMQSVLVPTTAACSRNKNQSVAVPQRFENSIPIPSIRKVPFNYWIRLTFVSKATIFITVMRCFLLYFDNIKKLPRVEEVLPATKNEKTLLAHHKKLPTE